MSKQANRECVNRQVLAIMAHLLKLGYVAKESK